MNHVHRLDRHWNRLLLCLGVAVVMLLTALSPAAAPAIAQTATAAPADLKPFVVAVPRGEPSPWPWMATA